MVLSIVAFGDKYIDQALPQISKFTDGGWDVHILTDKPEKFESGFTEYYPNKIFSYFDKVLFPLRLIEKLGESVLYIDADWLENINPNFINTFKGADQFLYLYSWPNAEYFDDYADNIYFTKILEFWKDNNFNYYNLPTILEWFYFIPKHEEISNIIKDIESIKPIFEYSSVFYKTSYPGIGNAEGLALSYILKKYNIPVKKINKISLGPKMI
jgi:hypothetical protein